MATEEIALKITTDASQTEKSVGNIRKELREATQAAMQLREKFGAFSPEAEEAKQKVANLKAEIADFKDEVNALNPDRKFQAFSSALQGVVGGFAGVQGAIGLFGTESAELEKQLLKVQSALALSEGLNAILESQDAFKNLGVVAVRAFNSIKTAIGATGIGLLVVALGSIVAYWDEIKEAVTGVNEEQQKLNRQTEKNVQAQKDKLNELDSQDAVLKQQGLSERQILKLKEAQTKELIKQQIVQLEGAKAAADAELKRTSEMYAKTVSIVGALAGTAAGASVANILFDPGKTAQKGADNIKEIEKQLKGSKNRLANYQNEVEQIDTNSAEAAKTKREQAANEAKKIEDEKTQKYLDDIKKKKEQADYEKQVEAETIADLAEQDQKAKDEANDRQRTATKIDLEIAEANYEAKKKIDTLTFEEKKKRTEETIDLLNNLASVVGQQTAAGKALGIATALINTYQGATEALKEKSTLPQPFSTIARFASAAAIIANGIRTVKQITAVKVPGGGGGGGGQGAGNPISGGAVPTQAPIASAVQVTQTSLTADGNNVNVQNQTAVKAFVVERDITDSQDRISKIKAAATL